MLNAARWRSSPLSVAPRIFFWDLSFAKVRSINASGHKFGLPSTWGWLDPYGERLRILPEQMGLCAVEYISAANMRDICA